MQYDLSFDTALQRLEKRVEGVERRNTAVASEQSSIDGSINGSINLGAGR